MASTYSSNLKIELMATGENSGTWGTNTNTNLGTAMEQAIIGLGNPDYTSDANLTITITDSSASQAARCLVLNVTSVFGSLTATRELIVPTTQKQYIVQNNTTGGQSITVKTSAGTGITVPTGRKAHLYVNGTNVIQMFDFVDINGGAIDGTPIGAASASTGSFTTMSLNTALPVASGGTGLSSGTSGGVLAYTATGTLASSAALAANALVIGGGAGAAPSTTTTGTGVVTALGVNVGTAGAFVVNGGALGTPSSGTVTNLTGTASININGTVGATTPTTGAFTTLSATGITTLSAATTPLLLSGAGSSSTTLPSNYAIRINAGLTAANYGGIFFDGSTVYDSFFGRVPTALSGVNDGIGYVTYASGTPTLRTLFSSTGLAVTGTLSATGDITSTGAIKANLNGPNPYALLQADSSGAAGGKIWTLASNATGSPIGTAGGLSVRSSTDSITVANFTSTGLAVTGTLSATGTGTLANLLFSGGTLPGAGTPSIALRSSDNVIYHQSGSANQITFLDSAQNSLASLTPTSLTFNISNVNKLTLNSTGLQVVNTLSGGTSGTGYSFDGSAPAGSLSLISGGRFGIGMSLPTSKLTIGNDSFTAAASNTTGMYTGANGLIVLSDGLFIATRAGVDRVILDTSGNLGVGRAPTAASTYKMLELDGAAGGYMRLYAAGTLSGYFYSSATESGIGSVTSAPFVFYTANTERARIDSSGNLLVGVATANANGGVLQLKSGITFPATAVAATDANTLDDYEEGTWTPSVGGTATYNVQSGVYTKIGRLVEVSFAMGITLLGTGSTTTISGLPFAQIAAAQRSTGAVGYYNSLAVNVLSVVSVIDVATSSIFFSGSTTASANITDSLAIFGNSANMYSSITYTA
jgi:hypothetical protein